MHQRFAFLSLNLSAVLAVGLAFVLISGYLPLFFNSLTVYIVHALAESGFGLLADDWYVSTLDPMTLFTWIFSKVFQLSDVNDAHGLVFLTYVGLCGVYVVGLVYAVARAFGYHEQPWLIALTIIAVVGFHSDLAGSVGERLIGIDVHTLFTKGVSGQALASAYLQPTTFVMFLMAATAAFLANKRLWASVFILISVLFHPGYLYTGAIITLAMMIVIWRQDGSLKNAILFGAITLVLVLPVTIQVLIEFGELDTVVRAEGHRILAVERAPHHALPSWWLRPVEVWLQMALIAGAIFVARRNSLGVLIAVPTLITALLTVYVAITDDYFVANVMPWRAFIYLVPLSTATLVGFAISWVVSKWQGFPAGGARALVGIGALVSILLAANGGRNLMQASAAANTSPYHSVFDYARENSVKGDIYLIPPISSGEMVSFAEFRVFSGVPIFVDEKSNPFAPKDMIEWWRRMQLVLPVFDKERLANCEALSKLVQSTHITHVASRINAPDCVGFHEVFRNENFVILKRAG